MTCFFLYTPNTNIHMSRHPTTHICRSMPILSVNGTPYFFVNLKQSVENFHRLLIPYHLTFQHQSYIRAPFLPIIKDELYMNLYHSRHSVILNPTTFQYLTHGYCLLQCSPLSLFYIKISFFTG